MSGRHQEDWREPATHETRVSERIANNERASDKSAGGEAVHAVRELTYEPVDDPRQRGGLHFDPSAETPAPAPVQRTPPDWPGPPPLDHDPRDLPSARHPNAPRDYWREGGQARHGGQARGSHRPHYWGHRQRVRERFEKGGAEGLPDYEIVEMILFNAVPRIDVKPLAKRLLADFGGIENLLTASRARLARHPQTDEKIVHQLKLCEAVAIRLAKVRLVEKPLFGGTTEVIEYFRATIAHQDVEHFHVLFLDFQNRLIADEEHGRGTVNHTPAYPREVARRALELNASGVVLVHNHPSGDPKPSRQDVAMTEQMQATLAVVNVKLLDHLIIGKGSETSLAALGVLG